MTSKERRIIELIQNAFYSVTLGNGVGLFESQGLDAYADAKTLAKYRAKDEKEDWHRLAPDDLNSCQSSLSFFDAEGMRFHLPAYLIASLEGTIGCDVVFCLTDLGYMSAFDLLNSQQRQAVREFLLHERDHFSTQPGLDDNPFVGRIEAALAEYWRPE